MKWNKKLFVVVLAYLVANVLFATVAAYTQTLSFLFVIAITGFGASFFAFQFGKQEERGFVLFEEDLPREIYQVVAVAMYGSCAVAILRDKKRKILACKSGLAGGNFGRFSIVNSEDGQFFVPETMGSLPATTLDTSLPTVGMAG